MWTNPYTKKNRTKIIIRRQPEKRSNRLCDSTKFTIHQRQFQLMKQMTIYLKKKSVEESKRRASQERNIIVGTWTKEKGSKRILKES